LLEIYAVIEIARFITVDKVTFRLKNRQSFIAEIAFLIIIFIAYLTIKMQVEDMHIEKSLFRQAG